MSTGTTTHLFPGLTTPRDLLGKIEFEFKIQQLAPHDPYAAFNVFVSLEHMPDWLRIHRGRYRRWLGHDGHPSRDPRINDLRVISHIANGQKHFEVDQHHDVTAMRMQTLPIDSIYKGRLIVHVDPAINGGQVQIDLVDLSHRGMTYWKSELEYREAIAAGKSGEELARLSPFGNTDLRMRGIELL